MLITRKLKDAASAAFQDNSKLSKMTLEERMAAAQQYEDLAKQMVGIKAGLARIYNLERAKFLRGQVSRLPHSAPAFAAEIGYFEEDQQKDKP